MKNIFRLALGFITLALPTCQALAQDDVALAKKLANPLESLISLPFQLNHDSNIGTNDQGERWTLNIQPVVPFSLNEEWNLISRTILPVIHQREISPGSGSQTGIGDVLQSVFFAPVKPTASGWQWGAGVVMLLPTGSNDLLTADKWGIGPTAAIIKQEGPWTIGGLFNHIWSFAGKDERPDISATYAQPFVSYTTSSAITVGIQTESTYDWKARQWSVPLHLYASKVMKIGDQSISLGGAIRYWAEAPDSGPEGWGGRLAVTFMLPK